MNCLLGGIAFGFWEYKKIYINFFWRGGGGGGGRAGVSPNFYAYTLQKSF